MFLKFFSKSSWFFTFIFIIFVVKYRISGKVLNKEKIILPMIYIGIFILLLNWIVKDCLLIFKGIDLLAG